jgi:hypothetical protein
MRIPSFSQLEHFVVRLLMLILLLVTAWKVILSELYGLPINPARQSGADVRHATTDATK